VSGSVQRTGQADTVLLVRGERVNSRVVSSTVTFPKLREEPDEYPLPVTFAIVSEGGSRTLRVVEQAGAGAPDDVPLETRVLERLAIAPRTKNALAETLSRSQADIDSALTVLFAAGRICSTTVKVRGCDRKAFRLRENLTRLSPDSTDPAASPDSHPTVTGRQNDGRA
jgi:hypothetical protein